MRTARDEEFHAFVVARRAGMLRTATLLAAGDGHLAEDVVQSTLTKLYVAWPLFSRATNQEGYARRALVNALVDEHRRPWRRRERPSTEVLEPAVATPEAGGEQTEALYEALRLLPPRMRAVVVYRYLHDLSVADTADALSCSQGTVKSQTARALDHLRAVLDLPAERTTPTTVPTPGPVRAVASTHTTGALDV